MEFIEIYGIRINRKEASLLRIVMEHELYEYQNRAMHQLAEDGSPEALEYIVMNHKLSEFTSRAMKALENR